MAGGSSWAFGMRRCPSSWAGAGCLPRPPHSWCLGGCGTGRSRVLPSREGEASARSGGVLRALLSGDVRSEATPQGLCVAVAGLDRIGHLVCQLGRGIGLVPRWERGEKAVFCPTQQGLRLGKETVQVHDAGAVGSYSEAPCRSSQLFHFHSEMELYSSSQAFHEAP